MQARAAARENESDTPVVPITVRQLEAVVRIAESYARMQLQVKLLLTARPYVNLKGNSAGHEFYEVICCITACVVDASVLRWTAALFSRLPVSVPSRIKPGALPVNAMLLLSCRG